MFDPSTCPKTMELLKHLPKDAIIRWLIAYPDGNAFIVNTEATLNRQQKEKVNA